MDLAGYERFLATLKADPAKPVIDGPIVAARYERANPRILWVLREHHGPNGWDYREKLATDQSLFSWYKGWKKTFGLVAKVSHGLLHGCIPYGDWANDASKLTEWLRDIAIVNFNKEGGDTRVDWDRFKASAGKYSGIVAKQIEYLDPQIVICAGTYGIVLNATCPQLPASERSLVSSKVFNGRVYLRAYHPNQRKLTHRAYYESVRHDVQQLLPLHRSS